MLGAYGEAVAALREAAAVATRIDAALILAVCSMNLVFALARSGDLVAARAYLDEPRTETEHHTVTAGHYSSSAFISLMEGSPAAALADSERALADAARSNDPSTLAFARAIHGKVLLALGRAPEALDVTRAGMAALAAGVRMQDGEALLRLAHAEALHATGRDDEARRVIADAEAWLLACVDDIDDDYLRACFLGSVEENRRILELARAWREQNAQPE